MSSTQSTSSRAQLRREEVANDKAFMAKIKAHPEYPHVFDIQGRDHHSDEVKHYTSNAGTTPVNIAYTIHGNGVHKVVLICGIGAVQSAWTRVVRDALAKDGKYTVLTFDNRGTGQSSRYKSMRHDATVQVMAQDMLGLIKHLGWANKRSIHAVGLSMGSMILQEAAIAQPTLFCSYTSLSGAMQAFALYQAYMYAAHFISHFVHGTRPTLREQLEDVYSDDWLLEKDNTSDPVVANFDTNRERVVAAKMMKKANLAKQEGDIAFAADEHQYQLVAAFRRRITPAAIREMHHKVGKSRSMIIHGSNDRMLGPDYFFVYLEALGIARKVDSSKGWEASVTSEKPWTNWEMTGNNPDNVQSAFVEGPGHMVMVEKPSEFFALFETIVEAGVKENETEEGVGQPLLYRTNTVVLSDEEREAEENASQPDWKSYIPFSSWAKSYFGSSSTPAQ